MGFNKSILLSGIILLICSDLIHSQNDKQGIIKIKKSKCFDLHIELVFSGQNFRKDTLTISEFNNVLGIYGLPNFCYEDHSYKTISYDMEMVGKWKKHINGVQFSRFAPTNVVDTEGKIIFTNCLIAATSLNKKDSLIVVEAKTFYIINDK